MRVAFGVVAVVASLLMASAALGDASQTGTVTGVVEGPEGSPLPGVMVRLEGAQGAQTTVTGADGTFRFAFLVPAAYVVRAEMEGLQAAEGSVAVTAGGRAEARLRLVATLTDEIAVIAEQPLVSKYEVSTVATLDAAVAEELVTSFRNYQSLWVTLPGVVQDVASTQLGERRPLVNGAHGFENASFVDGVDVSETRSGGTTRLWLPTTAVAEASMMGSGYGAEYGRVVGGVNMAVTKSGTNAFHGDFLYVAQNEKWRSQSDHVPLEREDEIIDSYELSLGGPIVRDRAWFFAAVADNTTNSITSLAGGDIITDSLDSTPKILKLHFSTPGQAHRLAVTGIDAPALNNFISTAFFDRYTVPAIDLGGDFVTGTWNWAMSSKSFIELRGAQQTSVEDRQALELFPVNPGASPDDPAGNQGTYQDQATGFLHHAVGLPLGAGLLEFPREQGNASYTRFAGSTEIKFGADYQQVSWETLNEPPIRYIGRNYDPARPGGFATPNFKRIFHPIDHPVATDSSNLALYGQGQIAIGDHWTLTPGLRLEDQEHQNDVGTTVVESSDWAPRMSVVYDVGGDGKLLVKATAGRYFSQIEQNSINNQFSTQPNGANSYDEYAWNAATRRYDIFRRTQLPPAATVDNQLDPFYKDEIVAGIEWQWSQHWAFVARTIFWEVNDQYNATDQFDERGQIFTFVGSHPEAERDYEGLQLELNRRFVNDWVLRTNYTLGRSEGNIAFNTEDLGEARSILDAQTGVPVSLLNRFGELGQDRTHIFNVFGAKSWHVNRHSFNLGGVFWYRSGGPWERQENVNLVHPTSGLTIQTVRYREPRGSNTLPDIFNLNLTGTWTFPLGSFLEGSLRVEAANVTDEQEQVEVNSTTGNVAQVRRSWQLPREIRAVVGVSF